MANGSTPNTPNRSLIPSSTAQFRPTHGTYVLSQPFKSPLKSTTGSTSPGLANPDISASDTGLSCSSSPLTTARHDRFGISGRRLFTDIPLRDSTPSTSHVSRNSTRFREKFLNTANDRSTIDPSLIKQDSALDISLRHARNRLLSAQQAHKYETTTITVTSKSGTITVLQDQNLQVLREKWQIAAQNASKYLFVLANERVQRMGGVSEFLKKTSKKRAFVDDEDNDEMQLNRARLLREGYSESQIDQIRDEYDFDVVVPVKHIQSEFESNGGPRVDCENDEEFTMELMLSTLNIDYNVVFPQ
ncbi:uncharacterized protein V1516DRAFT_670000 [Lipomyces oligophaga]|uniref:uncharacterized protein n=1 Tax=Lipomyces oligophaga TaxID=45792 RepID=UPI0034CFBBFD